jgi:hypothetical protein
MLWSNWSLFFGLNALFLYRLRMFAVFELLSFGLLFASMMEPKPSLIVNGLVYLVGL